MITDLDKNKNNNIDFEEFLDMMTARMSDRDTREDINKVFRLFDDDGTGTIAIRNLRCTWHSACLGVATYRSDHEVCSLTGYAHLGSSNAPATDLMAG